MSIKKAPSVGSAVTRTWVATPEFLHFSFSYESDNDARVTAVNLDRLDPELHEATIQALAIGSYPVAPRDAMNATGSAAHGLGTWVSAFIGWPGITAFFSGLLASGVASMIGADTNATGNLGALVGSGVALFLVVNAFRNRTVAVPLDDAIEADVPVSRLGNDIRSYAYRVQEALRRLIKESPGALDADIWQGCYQAQADVAVIHELRRLGGRDVNVRIKELLSRTSAFADMLDKLVASEAVRPKELAADAAETADIRKRLTRYLNAEPPGNYLELGAKVEGFEGYPGAGVYEPAELPSRSTTEASKDGILAAVGDRLAKLRGRS